MDRTERKVSIIDKVSHLTLIKVDEDNYGTESKWTVNFLW